MSTSKKGQKKQNINADGAETQFLGREQNFRELLQTAPIAIYEIDYSGPRFKSVNDETCRLTGYSREELLSMNPTDFLTPESRKRFINRTRRALAGERIEENVEFQASLKADAKYPLS